MSAVGSAVVVMTGGTSGLGLPAAHRIAATPGTHLILGARKPYTGPGEALPLDLASLDSVRAFASAVRRSLNGAHIDVLVLNAGTQYSNVDRRTEDGFETTFAVNHLAHYLFVAAPPPPVARRWRHDPHHDERHARPAQQPTGSADA
jgi:NAD(P)-dependent dehydrogenase (short-subunit alcohol dehydrogenase family)